MIYLVVALIAVSVALLVGGLSTIPSAEVRGLRRQLASIRHGGARSYRELSERRRRQERRQRIEDMLEALGERVTAGKEEGLSSTQQMLVGAGYRSPNAVFTYRGVRLVAAAGLGAAGFFYGTVSGLVGTDLILLAACGGVAGWLVPYLYVKRRVKKRLGSIQKALPDALDLLVVCVEAGLGLNQALQRVAEEIDRVSPELGEELTLVNLHIRAGDPREEALKGLARRTGLADVEGLVSMMVQTERFGTSIARALRVHADTLRTKRRQRAEESAAKLSVKMLIPLVFFIFPAIFVVILGPAIFPMMEAFGGT